MDRAAVDTNTWISGILFRSSVPGMAIDRLMADYTLLFSEETLSELSEVLQRSKFDRYVTVAERAIFLSLIERKKELCSVWSDIHVCRDPKDDKFLVLALDAKADILITGDKDLLALHPFGNLQILKPVDFLAQ